MPIGDCGFPPFIAVQDVPGGPTRFQAGNALLLLKGPTILVEVGFEAGLFVPDATQVQQVVEAMQQGQQVGVAPKLVEALVDTGAG